MTNVQEKVKKTISQSEKLRFNDEHGVDYKATLEIERFILEAVKDLHYMQLESKEKEQSKTNYPTNDHINLVTALDNHISWLYESFKIDDRENMDFHIRKIRGLVDDFADYFSLKKVWVQRPDDQIELTPQEEDNGS